VRSWEPLQLVCIYRRANAPYVQRLVGEVRREHGDAHLWALDQVADALASITVGQGPGSRLTLLNRLIAQARPSGPLVVCDDDISFADGSLRELLDLCRRARLDLAQPAHALGSQANHDVTHQVKHSVVRRTRFVEIGPLVVIAPRLRGSITPFPEDFGMGWGLDVVWSDLVREGYRFGIVDRVTLQHHGEIGAAYDDSPEEFRLQEELRLRGYASVATLHGAVATWPERSPFPFPIWLPHLSRWRPLAHRWRSTVSARLRTRKAAR